MKYYKLIDEVNLGQVVKDDNGRRYIYNFQNNEWVRSGIMIKYMWPDAPVCGQYITISKEDALNALREQSAVIKRLYKITSDVVDKYYKNNGDKTPIYTCLQGVLKQLPDIEYKIVACLHGFIVNYHMSLDRIEAMGYTYRILNSIKILINADQVGYEEQLNRIKNDENARCVRKAELKHDLKTLQSAQTKNNEKISKFTKELEFLK